MLHERSRPARLDGGRWEDGLPFAPIAGALRDLAGQLGVEALLELAGPGRDVLPSLLPELGARATAVAVARLAPAVAR